MTPLAVDYSAGPPSAAAIRNAGYRLVLRYLSRYTAKVLTEQERDDLLAHGLDIGLVFEDGALNALYGADHGRADAAVAATQAKSLGAPRGMTIYAAVDTDTTWVKVRPYLEGFADQLRAQGFRMGVYGSYSVVSGAFLEHRDWRLWQTRAWSGTPPRIHVCAALYQNAECVGVDNVSCDVDEIRHQDYGGWLAARHKHRWIPRVTLHPGDHGKLVMRLQRRLNGHGAQPRLVVDGRYGPATLRAVNEFKREHHLKQPGVVGPWMWRCLFRRGK